MQLLYAQNRKQWNCKSHASISPYWRRLRTSKSLHPSEKQIRSSGGCRCWLPGEEMGPGKEYLHMCLWRKARLSNSHPQDLDLRTINKIEKKTRAIRLRLLQAKTREQSWANKEPYKRRLKKAADKTNAQWFTTKQLKQKKLHKKWHGYILPDNSQASRTPKQLKHASERPKWKHPDQARRPAEKVEGALWWTPERDTSYTNPTIEDGLNLAMRTGPIT